MVLPCLALESSTCLRDWRDLHRAEDSKGRASEEALGLLLLTFDK